MRVLVDYRAALRQRSGVGEYTHQLVTALSATFDRARLDLTIFSSSWKDRLQLPAGAFAGATLVDARVPVRVLNFAWHRLGWPPAEAIAGGRFDVTHSQNPLLLPARSAAHVVTIHDLSFLNHPERTTAEIRRDYAALAATHARRADGILVPSQFTAREVLRAFGVDERKIVVCPAGAPPWTPRTAVPRDGYVLFLGTLEPRKNVGVLLDAWEKLGRNGSAQLVLAGRAVDDSKRWLERIAHAPLAGSVRHIGYVDPDKRRELFEGARLLVQPSFEEGFGLPVLEAMTAGVPVVAADRGSLPEVLGDAGPLVDADNPDAFASAIDRLLHDDAYAAACASKGVARAQRFNWHATARRVYALYEQAMAHRADLTSR